MKKHGYEAKCMNIQDYANSKRTDKHKNIKRTYYVSPANSLCFMDGGIDYALSRIMFPEIEPYIKNVVKGIGLSLFLIERE